MFLRHGFADFVRRNKRVLGLYVAPVAVVLVGWAVFMHVFGNWALFSTDWPMSVVMVLGSFVAGSTSIGGGAVAFPAMGVLYGSSAQDAANFCLAIQSAGMTAATLLIVAKRIPIDLESFKTAFSGSVVGLFFGVFVVAPMVPSAYAKIMFASFFFCFGIALFVYNHLFKRGAIVRLTDLVTGTRRLELVGVGALGGILTSIFGSGIDIAYFSYVTSRFRLSEAVATPTSVVLMTTNTLIGFFLHVVFVQDITAEVYNFWYVCIPIVVLGAPLGAYVASKVHRFAIAGFLYLLLAGQFISALVSVRPTGALAYFGVAVFLFGIALFLGVPVARSIFGSAAASAFASRETPDRGSGHASGEPALRIRLPEQADVRVIRQRNGEVIEELNPYDIGFGGVGIRVEGGDSKLSSGEDVSVDIEHHGTSLDGLSGRVNRVRSIGDGSVDVGIEFVSVDTSQREALRKFLEELTPDPM